MTDEAIQKLESNRVIDSQTPVVAAASGLVLDRQVTQGQVVQTAEPLCVIADLSSVWLVADVPEEHARALRMGKRVQAEIPALPGEKFSGLVSFIGATVNPETRTITARMDLANPQRRFKPQMLATMLLMDNPEQRIVVPLESVVRDGNDESIFVQIAPNRYRLQKVALGEETEKGRVVIGGLPPGTKIVTEGAFHLNNERRRKSGGAELASE
jgi:cobalt-zinc-cadmium efflux system membrane fusion protein